MDLSLMRTVHEGLDTEIKTLDHDAERLKKRAGARKYLQEAFHGLGVDRLGRRPCYPQHVSYGSPWSLLDRNGRRMWARELLDAPDEVAKRYGAQAVRPLAEALRRACPNGHADQLVVEWYGLTFSNVMHDERMYVTHVMCLECRGLYQIEARDAG